MCMLKCGNCDFYDVEVICVSSPELQAYTR